MNLNVKRTAGSIATIFFVGATAFAQSDARSREKQVSQPGSSQAENATGSMTVVGCLVREADYRRAHKLGKGALGGVGLGDEFVLVDAAPASNSTAPAASSGRCTESGTGQAYRMTGKLEEKLKPFVGHRMEITGEFDHPRDAKTAAGETNAKLPAEIKIASYREVSAGQASAGQAPAPSAAPATPAAPPVTSTPPPVASNQTSEERRLPTTASNEPLIALIGMISLSAALGVRLLRRREA